jgi:methyltransferase (TIGR00027 family)
MRTDNDTWDINSSVGITAIGVAVMRAIESHRPDAVFSDPYAEVLVAATDSPFTGILGDILAGRPVRLPDSPDGDPAGGGNNGGTTDDITSRVRSGLGSFIVPRTWYFDDYFRRAGEAGIRQVVILGSGLDARAYRLDWPAGTVVYELDQPEVLEFKAEVLGGHGAQPTADRRAVAIDLRHDWPAALRAAGFDPAARTAWLAEGLLRYLPNDGQVRLLENVAALSASGSLMAINFSSLSLLQEQAARSAQLRGSSSLGFKIGDLWYAEDDRVDPERWLAEHGWAPESVSSAEVLGQLHREVPEAAQDLITGHRFLTATAP